MTNAVKVAVGIGANDARVMAARDAYGVALDYNPLHYRGWPVRYIELFREARKTRKLLESTALDCLMVVVVGGDDELVSPDSRSFFLRQPACRIICLPEAGHYYYSESDKIVIAEAFADLIVRVRNHHLRP